MSITKSELVANYRAEAESDFQCEVDEVQFKFTPDLDAIERELLADGLRRLGTSESFNNHNEMGLSHFLREHGSGVGAATVTFAITPGKLRSAKRGPDGRIEIEAPIASSKR